MTGHEEMLDAARHAVACASTVTRTVQHRLDDFKSLLKPDDSPVSVADFAAQAIVAHKLGERLGPIAMVGEESATELQAMLSRGESTIPAQVLDVVRLEWPGATMDQVLEAIDVGKDEPPHNEAPYWTLDPIDGTKGFLRGQQYAISLAWLDAGRVELGALGCPNLAPGATGALQTVDAGGSLYTATRTGPMLESACVANARAQVLERPPHDPVQGITTTASVEKAHSHQGATAELLSWVREHVPADHGGVAAPARIDSQAKYAVVARGQADAYIRFPVRRDYVEKIWDHAAGAIVAEQAGVRVTDIEGKPLDFAHGSTLKQNRGIVCAAPDVHELLMEAIAARRAAHAETKLT